MEMGVSVAMDRSEELVTKNTDCFVPHNDEKSLSSQ